MTKKTRRARTAKLFRSIGLCWRDAHCLARAVVRNQSEIHLSDLVKVPSDYDYADGELAIEHLGVTGPRGSVTWDRFLAVAVWG